MKERTNNVFDEKDDRVVELFTQLGMPKNIAKTLMYICQVEECRSTDIEQAADLRQPEVSVAMQELRKRNWVEKRDLKKQGKGRPVHVYSPTVTLDKIIDSFEEEKLAQINDIRTNITELRESVSTF
ncbi:MAG: ArsR family transcriptional regulator [Candidatus Thermoplasmatota archaeon]|nr:ArsR family transcriptional regulator [Candidatus Thermoplasmatota archaeon]